MLISPFIVSVFYSPPCRDRNAPGSSAKTPELIFPFVPLTGAHSVVSCHFSCKEERWWLLNIREHQECKDFGKIRDQVRIHFPCLEVHFCEIWFLFSANGEMQVCILQSAMESKAACVLPFTPASCVPPPRSLWNGAHDGLYFAGLLQALNDLLNIKCSE